MTLDIEQVEQDLYVMRIYKDIKLNKYYSTLACNGIRIFTSDNVETKQFAIGRLIHFLNDYNAKT